MRDAPMNISQKAIEEAAGWMMSLQGSPGDRDCRRNFAMWLDQSDEHARAWTQMQRASHALDMIGPAFEAEWQDAERGVSPLAAERRRPRPRMIRRAAMLGAVAASLCLAIVAGPVLLLRLEADFLTSTSETRTVTLEDGSVVHLAGASAIATEFAPGRRGVRLLSGEAFFEVAHDRTRPFIVEANGVDVSVLGTRFDVQINGDVTTVALAEGAVRAEIAGRGEDKPDVLAPGDVLTSDQATGTVERTTMPVEDIATWRNGKIYVVNATIGSVVRQISRYHPAWLLLPDETLAGRRVTGYYDLSAPDQALAALVGPYGGKIRRVAPSVRLISRF